MPKHIPVEDQSKPASVDVRTPGEKRRDTIKKTRPDFYQNIGRKAGKNSKNRPFKDPEAARRAANARWGNQDDGKK